MLHLPPRPGMYADVLAVFMSLPHGLPGFVAVMGVWFSVSGETAFARCAFGCHGGVMRCLGLLLMVARQCFCHVALSLGGVSVASCCCLALPAFWAGGGPAVHCFPSRLCLWARFRCLHVWAAFSLTVRLRRCACPALLLLPFGRASCDCVVRVLFLSRFGTVILGPWKVLFAPPNLYSTFAL